jgi:DNA repair protein RecO (recombination protein O)
MDRERLYRTDGLILHHTDFGEADRLLTVFTPRLGRLRLLAKGARKPTSRKAGHVEPFTYVHMLVARGRNLDIVSQVETLETFRPLRQDLERASQAYYLAELINSFIEEGDENPTLFDLALATLARLCEARDRVLALRFFELRCLGLVGYQPQLHFCVECQTQLEPVTNYFYPPAGGVLCPRHGEAVKRAEPLAMPTFKVLRFMQTHSWDDVSALHLKPETHLDLEAVLQRYIVYLLERRLKSVEFIHRLRREAQATGGS